MKIFTFDTTLRDGTQGESVSFSVDDKLLIAQKLDELGIDYIEGGWPGSNPKDKDFFARAQTELHLKHAKLTAFGATRFARHTVEEDRSARRIRDRAGARCRGQRGRRRPARKRACRRRPWARRRSRGGTEVRHRPRCRR